MSDRATNALLTLRVIAAPDGSTHLWSSTHRWGSDPCYVVSARNGARMRREVKLGRPRKRVNVTCECCDRERAHPPSDIEPVPQTDDCREYARKLGREGLYLA